MSVQDPILKRGERKAGVTYGWKGRGFLALAQGCHWAGDMVTFSSHCLLVESGLQGPLTAPPLIRGLARLSPVEAA